MVLRLDSLLPAVLLAIAAVPLTIQGGQAGILQGERRWLPLALLYLAMGVPRVLIGTLCILWMPTETGAMLGITLGLLVPAAVGWWVLRRGRVPGETSDDHRARAVIRETILGSLALLAFFVLSNTDIVIARNVLDSHQAGLYAGGLILTKAVLFLPQFVVVVAYPSMSTVEQRRTTLLRSLALVSLLGALCTVGAVVLSGVAMVFIGGQQYVDVESRLWMFAILGTMLSMLQLLVYSVLARQGTLSMALVWVALGVLVAMATTLVSTVSELLAVVLAVDLVLLVVLLSISFVKLRERSTAQ
jgi:O-antigen/teichoic acid export membrane protein